MSNINITRLNLLNVPLENDYLHTLYFESLSAQYNYFVSKTIKNNTEFSYQRKDGIIRVPYDYDKIIGCNYVMYQNAAASSKWYYAFITDIKYVSNGMSEIQIETDVIQTWLFDYQVKASFVEREHVADDTIGANTIPESLELGDYICSDKNSCKHIGVGGRVVVGSTVDLNSEDLDAASGKRYNGVYSGVKYYDVTTNEFEKILTTLAQSGKSDAIVSIFIVPNYYIGEGTRPEADKYLEINESDNAITRNWNAGIFGIDEVTPTKPLNLNGYTPRNKKLFTYPYCYMLMSNNSGGAAVYKYEMFNNPNDGNLCDFQIQGALTPGTSIRLIPLYYNGVEKNNEEGLNLGKYPICNWTTDVYTNWLTQNGVNIAISLGSSLLQIGMGAAMTATSAGALVGVGAITSGMTGIASTMGEMYQHSLQPPQAEGNLNSGDVTFASGNLTFTAYSMSIKKEYAACIDEYFDMFGYKVNRVKVPNKAHRTHYWYTKTIDANIDGGIPMKDMQKIKDCYNKGITFWRDPNLIQDYIATRNSNYIVEG